MQLLRSNPVAGGIFLVILIATLAAAYCVVPNLSLRKLGLTWQLGHEVKRLDRVNLQFSAKTETLTKSRACYPLLAEQYELVAIDYLYCSPVALQRESQGLKLTDDIQVSDDLARRFHFWRRIYGLWSDQHYVLHLAHYPEVVLEVVDASEEGHSRRRYRQALRVLDIRKKTYERLFLQLDKRVNLGQAIETPTMKRLAAMMAHIEDPDKFKKAAERIRVQRGQRTYIESGLRVAPRYMAEIQKIFDHKRVPRELAYIAFVESSFNLKAESKVGAAGVFQIMPSIGRKLMTVNDIIDERKDPIKAASVAALIFKQNHRLFKSWPLAVTSYNHGSRGILNGVRQLQTNRLEDLISDYKGPAFGFASKNFYSSFLAMLAIMQEKYRYFPEIEEEKPLDFYAVRLSRPTTIFEVKQRYKLSSEKLSFYNPDIAPRNVELGGVLPAQYVLKLPETPFILEKIQDWQQGKRLAAEHW